MRKVWYVLVVDGGPYTLVSARLTDDNDVDDLRVQVKASWPNALAEVDAGGLLVYADHATFARDPEQQQSLPSSHRLHGLGLDGSDHVVVTVARQRHFRWREPQPLVCVSKPGATWDFQDSAVDKKAIAQDLGMHCAAWRMKNPNKQCHPVFVCCDGPGTGKSRLLDEFPAMVELSLFANDDSGSAQDEDGRALRQELSQNVYTFKIAFNEFTPVRTVLAGRPDLMIGTRMLYQMHEPTSWDVFLSEPRNHVTPSAALRRLSLVVGKEEKKLCVIICVDDMHEFQHEIGSRTGHTSEFIVALDSLRALSNFSDCLVTVLVATMGSQAMMDFHAHSTQRTRYLQTAVLSSPTVNGSSVFAELSVGMEDGDSEVNHALIQLLIDDMGGHARALEMLHYMMKSWNGAFAFITILDGVITALKVAYPRLSNEMHFLRKVILAVIARRTVSRTSRFDDLSLDQVLSCGFVRLEKSRLECPPVLFLFIKTHDSPWYDYAMYAPAERRERALKPWQSWEQFNCVFRQLKSEAFADDDSVLWTVVHNGARFGPGCERRVRERKLEYVLAKSHLSTNSGGTKRQKCRCTDDADVGKRFLYQPAAGSPSGDAGFCLEDLDNDRYVHEVHQYKVLQKGLTAQSFEEERRKAADEDDLFILFCAGRVGSTAQPVTLPANCAFVDATCWKEYYGPFAARAYYVQLIPPPCLNTSSRTQLKFVDGVGDKFSERIMDNRPFDSYEDAHEKTRIPLKTLQQFQLTRPADVRE